MEKDLIYNLIILDESGSMGSAYDATIDAFNKFLKNIQSTAEEFQDQVHRVTFVTFNTNGRKYLTQNLPPRLVNEINKQNYKPKGGTPLCDAIGFSVNELRNQLQGMKNAKVLVSIFTDGLENASREFSGKNIRDLVESLEEQGWTFTYFGTEHDVYAASININIKNVMYFEKSKHGMNRMLEEERLSRRNYYQKIQNKDMNLREDYFNRKK